MNRDLRAILKLRKHSNEGCSFQFPLMAAVEVHGHRVVAIADPSLQKVDWTRELKCIELATDANENNATSLPIRLEVSVYNQRYVVLFQQVNNNTMLLVNLRSLKK